jgi:hypothetical protein
MKVSGQSHASVTLSPGKEHRYPLERGLNGSWNLSGRGVEEKTPFYCRESNPNRPARRLVNTLSISSVNFGVSDEEPV